MKFLVLSCGVCFHEHKAAEGYLNTSDWPAFKSEILKEFCHLATHQEYEEPSAPPGAIEKGKIWTVRLM